MNVPVTAKLMSLLKRTFPRGERRWKQKSIFRRKTLSCQETVCKWKNAHNTSSELSSGPRFSVTTLFTNVKKLGDVLQTSVLTTSWNWICCVRGCRFQCLLGTFFSFHTFCHTGEHRKEHQQFLFCLFEKSSLGTDGKLDNQIATRYRLKSLWIDTHFPWSDADPIVLRASRIALSEPEPSSRLARLLKCRHRPAAKSSDRRFCRDTSWSPSRAHNNPPEPLPDSGQTLLLRVFKK